jgi:hypothetical protein
MDLIAVALDSMCAWGAVRICAPAVARVFAIAFAFVDKLVEGFDIEPTLITAANPTDPTHPVLSCPILSQGPVSIHHCLRS